jgi:acetyl-CoA acyltransferase 1
MSAEDLLTAVLTALREKSNIDPSAVDDVCVGNVLSPGFGYGARSAVLAAGFPVSTAVSVVNRFCSSGLLAIQQIATSISSGIIDIGIAAGVESMSNNSDEVPVLSEKAMQHTIARDISKPMGWTSENVAGEFDVSRERQDEYALLSHTRAARAQAEGWTADEIVPMHALTKDPESGQSSVAQVESDDGVRKGTTLESLSKIRPAFPHWPPSTTTGGNASQITDGAAAILVMKRSTAQELGQPIVGKFVSTAVVGLEPRIMGIGPSLAIPKVLERAGLTIGDIDLFEINEAFSSMVGG